MTSLIVGCTFCGSSFEVNPPDSIHTVAYRSGREGIDVWDFVPMNVKCPKCEKANWLYWYRPSYWINPFDYWNKQN